MNPYDKPVERWLAAGVVDTETAKRIRTFEIERARSGGRRTSVLLALAFGGVLIAAGVLLFVSANWQTMSPALRTATVLAMVAVFHVCGAAAAGRFEGLAVTFHAAGTVALGAGIFLAGQIFNLDEHWPSGVMLWAVGAWAGWWLRRDWPQLALAAVLTPSWLNAEWSALRMGVYWTFPAVEMGWFLLGLAYLTNKHDRLSPPAARTLLWLGSAITLGYGVGLAVKAGLLFEPTTSQIGFAPWTAPVSASVLAFVWAIAIAGPLAAALLLRGRDAWMNVVATGWALVLVNLHVLQDRLWMYPWLALLCTGLAVWGLRERRRILVNFAVVGFAGTVAAFYFETVMTKIGRSLSLIGLGLLFLGGGYLLERLRRRMIANLKGGVA